MFKFVVNEEPGAAAAQGVSDDSEAPVPRLTRSAGPSLVKHFASLQPLFYNKHTDSTWRHAVAEYEKALAPVDVSRTVSHHSESRSVLLHDDSLVMRRRGLQRTSDTRLLRCWTRRTRYLRSFGDFSSS